MAPAAPSLPVIKPAKPSIKLLMSWTSFARRLELAALKSIVTNGLAVLIWPQFALLQAVEPPSAACREKLSPESGYVFRHVGRLPQLAGVIQVITDESAAL